MSKPLTKEQIQLKKFRRLKAKSLKQLLLHRFLNNYGYDKGEVTARAIIDDYFLVSTLDDDLHHIHYGQLVWMAVSTDEYPKKGKSLAETRMKPVVLSFVTDEDIAHIAYGFDSKTLKKKRLERWIYEAFDQGALLTNLDLAVLLGICDAVVSQYVQEIQKEGKLLTHTRQYSRPLRRHHPLSRRLPDSGNRHQDPPCRCIGRPIHPGLPSR